MSAYALLAVFGSLIVLFSLIGGWFPLVGQVPHSRLQLYLSLSAGVMLGASFFHVMPEAMEMSGASFGWWMSLAVVGLFGIERFIAPHSHEITGGGSHHHGNGHHHHHPEDAAIGHQHDHDHGHEAHSDITKRERAAAPPMAGWMAVLGLTIHTFMNGVGLAGAVLTESQHTSPSDTPMWTLWALPGLSMFLAIVLHKPADALAISVMLSRRGVSRSKLALVQMGFALMVPVGVAFFLVTQGAIEESLRSQYAGFALAFSAGTFLFIALSDLLPEVQFHKHDRIPLFLSLAAGVIFMGIIARLEGDDHHGHGHSEETKGHEHGGHSDAHHHGDHDHDDHDEDEGHEQR
jgi:zinc and cadmium transporter